MFSTRGAETDSSVSREEISWRIKGRKKPVNRQADAWTPGVFVKISIVNPNVNERNRSNARGVSNGNKMINKI